VLPRANRLTSGEAFRRTIRAGRRAGSRTLVVHWSQGSPQAGAQDVCVKVGLVVSKAVGNAVTRNRVKRRLRHLVREQLVALPSAGVLVVRALPESATATGAELAADLAGCLGRIREREAL
jgi:ribonuclease P protein component